MSTFKNYFIDATGKMLFDMKQLLTTQLVGLQRDSIITTANYRQLTHPNANYGIAFINIKTVSDPYINEVLFSHSKVGKPEDLLHRLLTHGIKFIPLDPKSQRFDTLWVKSVNNIEYLYNNTGKPSSAADEEIAHQQDFFNRNVCAESKILEYIDKKLNNNQDVTGTIQLFTEKCPCQSCRGVINEFLKVYNKLDVNIYYER